ncbi:hypothetical protein BG005_002256, partial [Podila minutissima]
MYNEIKFTHEVENIEQDYVAKVTACQSPPIPSWGLIHISQRTIHLERGQPYHYPDTAGEHVTAYVIDTGVDVNHTEFEGRAHHGPNFVTESSVTDEHGHGTHIAAIIGGKTFGVAKLITIISIKAFNARGKGSSDHVIKALEWVTQKAVGGRSVVNMSFKCPKDERINNLVMDLFNNGIPSIVAAGNDRNQNVSNASPSGAPFAYTVTAIDDMNSFFVNNLRGEGIRVYAPGVQITSAGIRQQNVHIASGTSMAAAHVTGVAALYLSTNM